MADKVLLEIATLGGKKKKIVFNKSDSVNTCIGLIKKKLQRDDPDQVYDGFGLYLCATRDHPGMWCNDDANLDNTMYNIDGRLGAEFKLRPVDVKLGLPDRPSPVTMKLAFDEPVVQVLESIVKAQRLAGTAKQFTLHVGESGPQLPPAKQLLNAIEMTPSAVIGRDEPLFFSVKRRTLLKGLGGTLRRVATAGKKIVGQGPGAAGSSGGAAGGGSGSGGGGGGGGGAGLAGSGSGGAGGGDAASVFGAPLAVAVRRDGGLPKVIRRTVAFIEQHGLDTEGIFRLSGSSSKITEYRQAFDAGKDVQFVPGTAQIHDVCGTLKLYLRSLPEGVLTANLYDVFLSVVACNDQPSSQLHFLRAALQALPSPNHMLLVFLLRMLMKVREHKESNKMHDANISTIFGPVLLKKSSMQSVVEDTARVSQLTLLLLNNLETAVVNVNEEIPFCAIVQAEHDYAPAEPDAQQISFAAGDVLYCISQETPEWWRAVTPDGRTGIAPCNFTAMIHDFEAERQKKEAAAAASGSASGAAAPLSPRSPEERAREAAAIQRALLLQKQQQQKQESLSPTPAAKGTRTGSAAPTPVSPVAKLAPRSGSAAPALGQDTSSELRGRSYTTPVNRQSAGESSAPGPSRKMTQPDAATVAALQKNDPFVMVLCSDPECGCQGPPNKFCPGCGSRLPAGGSGAPPPPTGIRFKQPFCTTACCCDQNAFIID